MSENSVSQSLSLSSEKIELRFRGAVHHEEKQPLNTKPLSSGSESLEPNIRAGLIRESKQQLQTTKEIVVRNLHLPVPQHFCLIFERLPVWLFSIDREIASRVSIVGYESPTSFLAWCNDNDIDTTLINIVSARLGMGRLAFIPSSQSIPNDTKLLISGTLPYLIKQFHIPNIS